MNAILLPQETRVSDGVPDLHLAITNIANGPRRQPRKLGPPLDLDPRALAAQVPVELFSEIDSGSSQSFLYAYLRSAPTNQP